MLSKTSTRHFIVFVVLIGVCSLTSNTLAQVDTVIRYVDGAADPNGDGESWETAVDTLQEGLTLAEDWLDLHPEDLVQLWVAQGTYYPTLETIQNDPRSVTFKMADRTQLYGGFAGDEDDLNERDPANNHTILSGDLEDDDDSSNNSYHVVTATSVDATAVIDGFIVRDGNISNVTGLSTLTCGSQPNIPTYFGGGLKLIAASPVVRDCTFTNNKAKFGGGIGMVCDCNPIIMHCTFSDNLADDYLGQGGNGGGIWASHNCSPIIHSSQFLDNAADHVGGGVSTQRSGTPEIANSLFVGNFAQEYGGGIRSGYDVESRIVNCTIVANEAGPCGGGGISIGRDGSYEEAQTQIINCILWGNFLSEEPACCEDQSPCCQCFVCCGDDDSLSHQISFFGTGIEEMVTVSHCDIEGGFDKIYDPDGLMTWVPGTNFDLDPEFVNPSIRDYRLEYWSPCLNNGNESELPDDILNIDGNSGTTVIPWDLDHDASHLRQVNNASCVDIGSYENQEESCFGDVTGTGGLPDGVVDVDDMLYVLNHWEEPGGIADFAAGLTIGCGDGIVDDDDLDYIVGDGWGACSTFAPSGPPEWLEDCLENYGEDIEALIACIVENF